MPAERRVVTFDQDGTLWVEHPMYTQVMYCLDRVPAGCQSQAGTKGHRAVQDGVVGRPGGDREAADEGPGRDPRRDALRHDGRGISGRSETMVNDRAGIRVSKRPYTELIYQPMLEVLQYLRANGYKTYIVTGGGQDFVRDLCRATLRRSRPSRSSARGRNQVRLRQERQADAHKGAQAAAERQQRRQAGGHSPDDRAAAAGGVRQHGGRPANAGIHHGR